MLKTLVKGMVAEPDPDELERVVAAAFESGSLAPEETELRYSGDGLTVLQGTPEGDPSRFRGPAGLAAAMAELGAGFDGAEFQSKVKVVAVEELSASRVETEVMFLAMGTGEAGRVQLNTRWRVLWDVEESFQDPRLLRIDVEEFESKSLPGFWFQDCTTSAPAIAVARERTCLGSSSPRRSADLSQSEYTPPDSAKPSSIIAW